MVIHDRLFMDEVWWMVYGNKLMLSGSTFLAGALVSSEKHVLTKHQSVRFNVPSRGLVSGKSCLEKKISNEWS